MEGNGALTPAHSSGSIKVSEGGGRRARRAVTRYFGIRPGSTAVRGTAWMWFEIV